MPPTSSPRIDAHAHLPLPVDTALAYLEAWGVERVMNICVAHTSLGGLDAQRGWYRALSAAYPDRFAWATSFPLEGFGSANWAETAISVLSADLAESPGRAAGVKVWKNVGMELRDPVTGEWVFLDDPRFEPVLAYIEQTGVPLLTHQAEPIAAWLPLDPRNPHYGYYSVAKQWHWHGRTDVPTHARILAGRDAVLARFPKLRLVGLHLGSHEHDLGEVAARLERFPQYTVDTGARLGDLAVHAERDRDGLVDFLCRYQDRVMWGIDWVLGRPVSGMTPDEQLKLRDALARRHDLEWRFFATDEALTIAGREVRGLALPAEVLARITCDNARQTYWGAGEKVVVSPSA